MKNPGSKTNSREWPSSTPGLAVRIVEDNQSLESEYSAIKHTGGQGEEIRLNAMTIYTVLMSTISPAESLIWSVAQKPAEKIERGSSVREVKRVIQAGSRGQDLPGNRTNIALDNQGLETQNNKTNPKECERKMSQSLEKAIQALRREMETMFEEAYIADPELKKASRRPQPT